MKSLRAWGSTWHFFLAGRACPRDLGLGEAVRLKGPKSTADTGPARTGRARQVHKAARRRAAKPVDRSPLDASRVGVHAASPLVECASGAIESAFKSLVSDLGSRQRSGAEKMFCRCRIRQVHKRNRLRVSSPAGERAFIPDRCSAPRATWSAFMADVNRIVGIGLLLCAGLAIVAPTRAAEPVKAGAGTYVIAPKGGDKGLPRRHSVRRPCSSGQRPRASGTRRSSSTRSRPDLRSAPDRQADGRGPGDRAAWQGSHGDRTPRHRDRLPAPGSAAGLAARLRARTCRLAGAGDWSIDISMARDADEMRVTVAHGNPYVYIRLTRGDLAVRLPAAGERFGPTDDARVLALR